MEPKVRLELTTGRLQGDCSSLGATSANRSFWRRVKESNSDGLSGRTVFETGAISSYATSPYAYFRLLLCILDTLVHRSPRTIEATVVFERPCRRTKVANESPDAACARIFLTIAGLALAFQLRSPLISGTK